MEREANEWHSNRLTGMIDENGEVKECDQDCHDCVLASHHAASPCPKDVVRR